MNRQNDATKGLPTFPAALLQALVRDGAGLAVAIIYAVTAPFLLFFVERWSGVFFFLLTLLIALAIFSLLRDAGRLASRPRRFWKRLAGAFACMGAATLVFSFANLAQEALRQAAPEGLETARIVLYNCLISGYYFLVVIALERRPHRLTKEPLTASQRALAWPSWFALAFSLVLYLGLVPALIDKRVFESAQLYVVYYLMFQVYLSGRILHFFHTVAARRWKWVYGALGAAQVSFLLGCLTEGLHLAGRLGTAAGTAADAFVVLFLFLVITASRLRHVPLPPHEEAWDAVQEATWTSGARRTLTFALVILLVHFGLYGLSLADPEAKPYRDLTVTVSVLALGAIAALQRRRRRRTGAGIAVDWLDRAEEQDLRLMVERSHADDILYRTGGRFTQLFRSCPDLMSVHRLGDGRILEVNRTFTRSLGYRRYDLVGRTCEEVGFWATEKDSVALRHRLAEQGKVRDLPVDWRDASGEIHGMVLSASVLQIREELVYVSLARRLTPGRRPRTALFDRVRDAVVILDLQGRVTYWNPAAEKLYGWSAMESMGRFATELFSRSADASPSGEVPFAHEETHLTRRGVAVDVDTWSTLLCDREGRPRSCLLVSRPLDRMQP